jgi:hypothetical protein
LCAGFALIAPLSLSAQEFGTVGPEVWEKRGQYHLACIEREARRLEPLQDDMLNLATLVVISSCYAEVEHWIREGGTDIDKERTRGLAINLAADAIVRARIERLEIEDN